MKLGFDHENPTARPPVAKLKGWSQDVSDRASGDGVARCRPGMRYEPPEKDLGHLVLWHGEQVLVRCSALRGLGHGYT